MNNHAYATQPRRPVSIDGIRRKPMSAPTAPASQPPKRKTYQLPRPEPAKHGRWQKLQLPLLLLAGSFAGFFAENLAVGLTMLGAYGIAAFFKRIPSRTTFTLTLLLLIAISVMLLAKPSGTLIQNFSTYAFVLLVIGVITLGREARLPKRTRHRYRR